MLDCFTVELAGECLGEAFVRTPARPNYSTHSLLVIAAASTEEPPTVNTEPVFDSRQTLEKFEVSISDILQVLRTIDSN